ncbi:hypothetical protein ABT369_50510 [Dactylosporangium sp. NPDC000244]|uniref:hypothetical protein n=1 Tax=Dactylosporangium sp. NPDC000244 TaxID=3154365 RepID=UPI003326796F
MRPEPPDFPADRLLARKQQVMTAFLEMPPDRAAPAPRRRRALALAGVAATATATALIVAGLPVIEVDTTTTEDALTAQVAQAFGL